VRRSGDGRPDALDSLGTVFVRQPDGRFVAAEWPGLGAAVAEIEVVGGDEIARVPVTLVDGETVDVRVALAPGLTIHGASPCRARTRGQGPRFGRPGRRRRRRPAGQPRREDQRGRPVRRRTGSPGRYRVFHRG